MYFPENMTFQYFFFDTYFGYFLQVLPIALFAGLIYWLCNKRLPLRRRAFSSVFVCYCTGLMCLVLLIDIISSIWFFLFYHMESGRYINWLSMDYNLVPNFWNHLNGESIGNMVLLMPFGVLFPLCHEKADLKRTVLAGFTCSIGIEILQPLLGRAFDINDVILNTVGIIVSSALFFSAKKSLGKYTAVKK